MKHHIDVSTPVLHFRHFQSEQQQKFKHNSKHNDVRSHTAPTDINQPSLPIPFYSVLVSLSVCMARSTVFHSINSPNNSPLSHSVFVVVVFWVGVLFVPYW